MVGRKSDRICCATCCLIGISAFGWAEMIPVERYKMNMEVNYFGVVRVSKAFLPLLRASKGRLVNMGSIGGRMASAFGSAYLSTKAQSEPQSRPLEMLL